LVDSQNLIRSRTSGSLTPFPASTHWDSGSISGSTRPVVELVVPGPDVVVAEPESIDIVPSLGDALNETSSPSSASDWAKASRSGSVGV